MTIKINKKQVIVALDLDSFEETEEILKFLDPNLYRVKIGKQLFMNSGPEIVNKIQALGFDIFLDLSSRHTSNFEAIASECVITTRLVLYFRFMFKSMSKTILEFFSSKLPVGSSANKIFG